MLCRPKSGESAANDALMSTERTSLNRDSPIFFVCSCRSTATLIQHISMIQRSLLRQSRAIGSSLYRSPSVLPSRLCAPAARRSPIPVHHASPARWYSAETNTEPTTGAQASQSEQAAPEAEIISEAEDPLKKELETKNREIIDLKVWTAPPTPFAMLSANGHTTGQISTLRR